MASKAGQILKRTTGLTGIPVCEHPHHMLRHLYDKVLRALQKVPQESVYKQSAEKIVTARLALVNSEPDVTKLEEKIGMGQIEEVIIQAENELKLARNFGQWKAWEPLTEKPLADQWRWPV